MTAVGAKPQARITSRLSSSEQPKPQGLNTKPKELGAKNVLETRRRLRGALQQNGCNAGLEQEGIQ